MKELVIHAGIHRTGSTSIQNAMKQSRGILRSHGVLYPVLYGLPDHVKIPWWIINNKISVDDLIGSIKEKDESFIEKIVLSAEDFSLMKDFSWLDKMKSEFDVKFVVYLKNQVDWLESWYNQNIKWPWDKRFSSCKPSYFLDKIDDFYWLDYNVMLDEVSKRIGSDNVYAKPVGKSNGSIQDTANDFFPYLKVDTRWLNKLHNTNKSLSSAKIHILRNIDLMGFSAKERTKLIKALDDIEIKEDNGEKHFFSKDQVESIFEKFEESNNKLSERYFGGENIFPFDDLGVEGRDVCNISDTRIKNHYFPKIIKSLSGM
nr:hypothetical protein [Halomonas elongata]